MTDAETMQRNKQAAIGFVGWVQGYYGKYLEGQREDINRYVSGCSPSYLAALRDELLTRYSRNRDQLPPDIAVFERMKPEALEKHEARIALAQAAVPQLGVLDDPKTYTQMQESDWGKILTSRCQDWDDSKREQAIKQKNIELTGKTNGNSGKRGDLQASIQAFEQAERQQAQHAPTQPSEDSDFPLF